MCISNKIISFLYSIGYLGDFRKKLSIMYKEVQFIFIIIVVYIFVKKNFIFLKIKVKIKVKIQKVKVKLKNSYSNIKK